MAALLKIRRYDGMGLQERFARLEAETPAAKELMSQQCAVLLLRQPDVRTTFGRDGSEKHINHVPIVAISELCPYRHFQTACRQSRGILPPTFKPLRLAVLPRRFEAGSAPKFVSEQSQCPRSAWRARWCRFTLEGCFLRFPENLRQPVAQVPVRVAESS